MKILLAVGAYVRKSLVSLVGAEIGWIELSLRHGFGAVTFDQWMAQVVLVATALGVYLAPNAAQPNVGNSPEPPAA